MYIKRKLVEKSKASSVGNCGRLHHHPRCTDLYRGSTRGVGVVCTRTMSGRWGETNVVVCIWVHKLPRSGNGWIYWRVRFWKPSQIGGQTKLLQRKFHIHKPSDVSDGNLNNRVEACRLILQRFPTNTTTVDGQITPQRSPDFTTPHKWSTEISVVDTFLG